MIPLFFWKSFAYWSSCPSGTLTMTGNAPNRWKHRFNSSPNSSAKILTNTTGKTWPFNSKSQNKNLHIIPIIHSGWLWFLVSLKIFLPTVLSYLGYALTDGRVSWYAGVKITFRSPRSPQPRYRGITLQPEKVSKYIGVKIIFLSLVPQKPKCSTY